MEEGLLELTRAGEETVEAGERDEARYVVYVTADEGEQEDGRACERGDQHVVDADFVGEEAGEEAA